MAAYWSDRTFDGFPFIPITVSSDGRKGDAFKSASEFMVNHVDRRKNEIVIRKCQFVPNRIPCEFWQSHPVNSAKVLDVFEGNV